MTTTKQLGQVPGRVRRAAPTSGYLSPAGVCHPRTPAFALGIVAPNAAVVSPGAGTTPFMGWDPLGTTAPTRHLGARST